MIKKCRNCKDTFECTEVCKDDYYIFSRNSCYCGKCYLACFGEEDAGWKSLRHKCYDPKFRDWRIA